VKDRVCKECKGAVEDEIHFLMECPVYLYTREEMFEALKKCGVKVEEGEGREAKWKKVMAGTMKQQCKIVGKYAAVMLRQRAEARKQREERGTS